MTRPPLYRMLAVDVDGTLVNSNDTLTPKTREALLRAGRAGVHLVVATGRRYSQTLHLVEPLGLSVPIVTASGALVKDPLDHRTLYRAGFDSSILTRVLNLIEGAGHDALLCGDTYLEDFDFYCARFETRRAEMGEYVALNPGRGRVWPNWIGSPAPAFAGFSMGTRPQMLELESLLHRTMPGKLSTHVLRSPRYRGFFCEFAPGGVTKWSAIRRLADGWGIPVEAICAVGDDVNDIPMIRSAGLGVAMGNALPEVKAVADRVVAGHDDDGLVEVVEWLLESSSW